MTPYTICEEILADETFRFECCGCGECCRDIKDKVMIESLDLFRIAQHLKLDVAEVANQYTEAVTLCWGAPILVMKTKLTGDVCCFLKSGRCSIQPVKPRACRLYPLSMGPDDKDIKNVLVFKSSERAFHYTGKEHIAGEWVAENMDNESYAYILTEFRLLKEIGKLLRRIPRYKEPEVNQQMIMYRYILFETDQDFMSQYVRNMAQLKSDLEKMKGGSL